LHQQEKAMAFKKGQSGNPKGREKGSKNKTAETFYADCLHLYEDPDGFNGYEGLKAYVKGNPRRKEQFVAILAKWAEKQIKQEVDHTGQVDHSVNVKVTFVETRG